MTSDDMAPIQPGEQRCARSWCGHRRAWHKPTCLAGGVMQCGCPEFVEQADDDQPDVAPSPDVDAGGAGLDMYRVAAEAYDRRDDPADLEPPRSPDVLANHPPFRAAIDAARAPLLVELAGTRQMLDVMVNGENATMDELRAEVARLPGELDEARRTYRHRCPECGGAGEDRAGSECSMCDGSGKLSDTELLRLLNAALAALAEARAKTEGGEQVALLTAVASMHRRVAAQHEQVTELVERHMAEIARELQRIGRVLPVTDDAAAP